MRKLLVTLALSSSLIATSALADQKTLQAMQKAGAVFTEAEAASLKEIKCNPKKSKDSEAVEISASCQDLVNKVAELVAAYADNDQMVEAILRGAVEAHPELATQIADAAIIAAPDAVALIAGLMTEIAPTAAGLDTAPGLAVATAVANPNNNIPTPAGGGGSSSPN